MQVLTQYFSSYLVTLGPFLKITRKNKELVLTVYTHDLIKVFLLLKLHTNCQFTILSDICAVDYPTKQNRFKLVYHMLSLHYNFRITICTELTTFTAVPSITSLYSNANWCEREIWDLFGIFFINHPDLRRILTDYGFEGYPLRKDFPLIGFVELKYDFITKSLKFEPTHLKQTFNLFKFKNPWKNF